MSGDKIEDILINKGIQKREPCGYLTPSVSSKLFSDSLVKDKLYSGKLYNNDCHDILKDMSFGDITKMIGGDNNFLPKNYEELRNSHEIKDVKVLDSRTGSTTTTTLNLPEATNSYLVDPNITVIPTYSTSIGRLIKKVLDALESNNKYLSVNDKETIAKSLRSFYATEIELTKTLEKLVDLTNKGYRVGDDSKVGDISLAHIKQEDLNKEIADYNGLSTDKDRQNHLENNPVSYGLLLEKYKKDFKSMQKKHECMGQLFMNLSAMLP